MTTYTEGELAAARRSYVPADHEGLSFEEFSDAAPDELAKLCAAARKAAEAVGEDLDHLEASSTATTGAGESFTTYDHEPAKEE